jgi:hypothetical protein
MPEVRDVKKIYKRKLIASGPVVFSRYLCEEQFGTGKSPVKFQNSWWDVPEICCALHRYGDSIGTKRDGSR